MIIEQIVRAGVGTLAVSRCLDPELRRRLLLLDSSRELPCVRGRTVVPDSCTDTVVVGHPNYLGVFDRADGPRAIVVTGAWSQLRPIPAGVIVVAAEGAAPEPVAVGALSEARRLAKRLRQVRGVQLAIRPKSPVIVALLPFQPGPLLLATPGVTVLGGAFPEYPGGIRIEPPVNDVEYDPTRYAASLEQVIIQEA